MEHYAQRFSSGDIFDPFKNYGWVKKLDGRYRDAQSQEWRHAAAQLLAFQGQSHYVPKNSVADIKFQCPHCGSNLAVEDEGAGMEIPCPICAKSLSIPNSASELAAPAPAARSKRLLQWAVTTCAAVVIAAIASVLVLHHWKRAPRNSDRVQVKPKAESEDANEQYYKGLAYRFGIGVAKDEAEAAKWFRKAAEKGLPAAQFHLGRSYHTGSGVAEDHIEAVKWYRKAAAQNDGEAQFNLGVCYSFGQGVPKDDVVAVDWYRKAAEQNHATAQYNMGICYALGKGIEQDQAEAVSWYRKAAEQNNVNAQVKLGVCFSYARGVATDYTEAVKWFQKAAEQNNSTAQFGLGRCYANGQGVVQDYTEAVKWYRKAAEQNLAQAQSNLGVCYQKGEGVAKNDVEGVKWFRKAAEQNDAQGQSVLGFCYAFGRGVAKDEVEAYKWLILAAGKGEENANKMVSLLEAKMGREEIAEGQKLARNFKSRQTPSAENDSSSTGIAKARPESYGTGFFITEDGFLITNEHVVKESSQVRLVTSAGIIAAKVVKVDAANDLALLKAEGRFAALPVVASRGMRLGSTVATVGFPNVGLQGFAPKLARGEIAALSGAQDDARYFQISVPVQPGNSGGALVEERGNVVGVVSAKLSARAALAASGALPENVNYAVKSSFLLSFLESVPEVSAKLKDANTKERKFEDVVKSVEQAAVLVLVY